MRWTHITPADLDDAKVAALVTALRTAALAEGQDDRSTAIIKNVVTRIRAEIAGCRTNALDADLEKIPGDLKSLALRLILVDLKNALEEELTEDERRAWSKDTRYLERIAECKVPVAAPDDPLKDPGLQSATGAQTTPLKETKRENLNGL